MSGELTHLHSISILRCLPQLFILPTQSQLTQRSILIKYMQSVNIITIPGSSELDSLIERYITSLVMPLDQHILYFEWTNITPTSNSTSNTNELCSIIQCSPDMTKFIISHEEDYCIHRQVENSFLKHIFSSHKTDDLEPNSLYITCKPNLFTIYDLIQVLSRKQCFLWKPVYSEKLRITCMPWFLSLTYFTLSQYVANCIEIQIYNSLTSNYQLINKNILTLTMLRNGFQCMRSSEQILRQAIVESVQNMIVSADTEKILCLTQVSQKRVHLDGLSKVTSKYNIILHRLWILNYVTTLRYVCHTLSTVIEDDPHDLPRLLGVPISHLLSPVQELFSLVFTHVYNIAVSEYYSHVLVTEQSLTLANAIDNSTLLSSTTKKKKKKKKKSHSKAKEDSKQSMTESLVSSDVDETLVLSIAPAQVSRKLVEATEGRVIVRQLINEIIDGALSLVKMEEPVIVPYIVKEVKKSCPVVVVAVASKDEESEMDLTPENPSDLIPENPPDLIPENPSDLTPEISSILVPENPPDLITENLQTVTRVSKMQVQVTEVSQQMLPEVKASSHHHVPTPTRPPTPRSSTHSHVKYYDDNMLNEYYLRHGASLNHPPYLPFDSNFSFYSLWLTETSPIEVSFLSENHRSSDQLQSLVDKDCSSSDKESQYSAPDEEADGDGQYATLTIAALRAHTVYYESQLGISAEEAKKKSRNKSEGLGVWGSKHRRKVTSAFAPSIENSVPLIRRNSFNAVGLSVEKASTSKHQDYDTKHGDVKHGEQVSQNDSSLGSGSNQGNPVALILSSRLLRSEATRAAGVNHQAVMSSIISQMQKNSSSYAYYTLPVPVSGGLEVMSEDGTKMSWKMPQTWTKAQAFTVQPAPLPGATFATSTARSISSLPSKYGYERASVQSFKYAQVSPPVGPTWSPQQAAVAYSRHRSLSLTYKSETSAPFRSNPDLIPLGHIHKYASSQLSDPSHAGAYVHHQEHERNPPVNEVVSDNMNLSDDEDLLLSSQLTYEINDFIMKLDTADAALRKVKSEAVLKMVTVVRSLWPRAHVKPFGSFISGLSLPSSDLDLVICMPKVHQESAPEASGALEGRNAVKETWQQNLARGLRNEQWVDVHTIKIIRNTAVPVLKFNTIGKVDQPCVSLDISFESPGHRGLESNKLVSSLMQTYPLLRPLVLVLKAFLTTKCLCEAFTGGISSYAVLLVTARFLQETEQSDINDTGAVLLGILKFIGDDFDPRYTGISLLRRCYFPRTIDGSSLEPGPGSYNSHQNQGFIPFKFDPLFIEDPLTPGNNVGRNCFRILQVQKTCSDAYDLIVSTLRSSERDGVAQPLLESIVGRF